MSNPLKIRRIQQENSPPAKTRQPRQIRISTAATFSDTSFVGLPLTNNILQVFGLVIRRGLLLWGGDVAYDEVIVTVTR
jgi:hypothetical protein